MKSSGKKGSNEKPGRGRSKTKAIGSETGGNPQEVF